MRCESFWQYEHDWQSPNMLPSLSSCSVSSASRSAETAFLMRLGLMLRVAFCHARAGCDS